MFKSPLTVLYFLNGKITNKTDFKLIKIYHIGRKSVSGRRFNGCAALWKRRSGGSVNGDQLM